MMSDALAPAPLGLASGPTLVHKIRGTELANPFSLSVAGSRAPAIHKRSTDHSELASRLPRSGDIWPEADRKLWLQLLEGNFNLIYKDKQATTS